MDVRLTPAELSGRTRAPPSKSYTHRAVLAAGYADGAVVVDPLDSADTRATVRAVETFGGGVRRTDRGFSMTGFSGRPGVPADVVDCANSGTTMRLVTAAAALADGTTVLTGDKSLRSRPQGPLLDAIEELGGRAESTRANGQAPLVVTGPIDGGAVTIPGDVSSQFVTALLMAGAVTKEGVTVNLDTELKSAPYVEVTREVLADFGVETDRLDDRTFVVPGGQRYDPAATDEDGDGDGDGEDEYVVPGDFSSISYLLAAGALVAPDGLVVENARPGAQGDAAIVDVVDRMGADVDWDRGAGEISVSTGDLSGVTVSVADTPDLLPTIAALGAAADGETYITDAEHVRYKETDRVAAMAEELAAMDVAVTEREAELVVHGGESTLRGATVDGRGDHRIVMALSVAALVAEGETTVRGAEHVEVSFPEFFSTLEALGADVGRSDSDSEN
jgi:3-phosphoshikimate 1-carboxyvinyltransferase